MKNKTVKLVLISVDSKEKPRNMEPFFGLSVDVLVTGFGNAAGCREFEVGYYIPDLNEFHVSGHMKPVPCTHWAYFPKLT